MYSHVLSTGSVDTNSCDYRLIRKWGASLKQEGITTLLVHPGKDLYLLFELGTAEANRVAMNRVDQGH